jgi:chromosome segregation ATPase
MGKSKASKANDAAQQQVMMQDCSGDGPVETGYRYDPNRGRRTTAYSAKEMQRLSAAHRARLKRNRELAKASKERKKQRLLELQQHTAELEATMPQLRAELAAKQAALQQARAQTVSLLEACSCDSCKNLQGQLQQLGSS